jgi:DNA-binding transcriptional MerR regulator
MKSIQVGQLARHSGLTVRTLHHYDEIGLLSPSERTEAGYRLYDSDDVGRLTQILLLRRLDLSLAEIREILARPESSLQETIGQQISRLKEKIEFQTQLVERLEAIHRRLELAERVSVDQLTRLMEIMTMFDKYYTPEQMEYLKKRGEELGEEEIRQAETEWPQLIGRMQEEMAKGTDPASEGVQALAKRWQELVQEFTGGDAGIESSLRNMYGQEPQLRQQTGMDPSLMEFVAKANAAGKSEG